MKQDGDIWTILRKKFPVNEFALMAEVSDAAGFHRSRSADYIAMNLWPSRGLHINGIELKSFRGDWLSELKKPQKAENIFQFCDYFWLLTTDDKVANLDEIPATWGWMAIKNKRIFIQKDAPKLEPTPTDRHFLAALLKRAENKDNFVHIESIQERLNAEYKKGEEKSSREIEHLRKELSELRKEKSDFETASGITLGHRWNNNSKEIGDVIKIIQNGGTEGIKDRLINLERTSSKIHNYILNGIKSFENIEPKTKHST